MRLTAMLLLVSGLAGCDLEHLTEGEPEAGECGGRRDGFCAAQSGLAFCDDFESEAPLDSRWSSVRLTGDGALEVEEAGGCGESRGAFMKLNEGTGGCTYADLAWGSDASFSRVTLSADLLNGEPGSGADFEVNPVLSLVSNDGDDSTSCIQLLNVQPDLTRLHTQRFQVFDDFEPLDEAVPLGTWTHVVMELAAIDGKAEVSVEVDGKPALTRFALPKCGAGAGFEARVGLYCRSESITQRADNVTVRIDP